MLVHEIMSTGLVTAKNTDTIRLIRCDENDELPHCGAIPVVEGDTRLIGMVTLPDILLPLSTALGESFLRIKNKCYGRLWL